MLRNVEAFHLLLARNPQRDEGADQFEQDEGHAARPHQGDCNAVKLDQQLVRIALRPEVPPIEAVAKTPASRIPVNPPTPWTPNTSSESS